MKLEIFDVEHGSCALFTTDTNRHVLVDCGHNSSTNWRPSIEFPKRRIGSIDHFFVSNADEDHVSDLVNLRNALTIDVLHKNPTVSGADLLQLKSETGAGNGIRELSKMLGTYTGAVANPPDLGGLTYKSFWNKYPTDFDDENNLSLVTIFRCHDLVTIFAGDLEKAGWKRLLLNADFRREIQTINIFVASHHGRESGCCEEVFNFCKPEIFIISDQETAYDTQKTQSWYGQRASGINFYGTPRRVFTTRSDGNIVITATPGSTTIDTF